MKRKEKHSRRLNERPEIEVPLKTGLFALFAIVAAGAAVLLMFSVTFIYGNIYPVLERKGKLWLVFGSLAAIVVSSLAVGLLFVKFLSKPVGSGIPQLKLTYRNKGADFDFRKIWVNFLAGIVSLGGGISLGREGPTVFAGGAVAAACARWFGMPVHRRKLACVTGAAAGLAAAFNTPLAATMFVIEEISDRITGRHLGGVLIASVIGACASWIAIGRHPAYDVPRDILFGLTSTDYMVAPFAALFAAMTGVWFQNRTLAMREKVKFYSKIKPFFRPLVGGLCVWVIGISVYFITDSINVGRLGIFSMDIRDLHDALNGKMVWQAAALLLLAKVTATSIACAFGCSGGIFAPSLFLGAMAGVTVAGLAQFIGVELGGHGTLLQALVGMSACFGTVVRAPLTALLIVFEMTGRYELVPPLMIATVISQAYAYYFSGKISIYEAMLRQDGLILKEDGAL